MMVNQSEVEHANIFSLIQWRSLSLGPCVIASALPLRQPSSSSQSLSRSYLEVTLSPAIICPNMQKDVFPGVAGHALNLGRMYI